jgi:hypothetical protein
MEKEKPDQKSQVFPYDFIEKMIILNVINKYTAMILLYF